LGKGCLSRGINAGFAGNWAAFFSGSGFGHERNFLKNMAIDFLGKQGIEKKNQARTPEKLHVPEKEIPNIQEPAKKIEEKVEQTKVEIEKEELGESNLIPGFKAGLKKRHLILGVIIVIIGVVLLIGTYYLFLLFQAQTKPVVKPTPVINLPVVLQNQNLNAVTPAPVQRYSCNSASGICVQNTNGAYSTFADCQTVCFKPTPTPPPSSPVPPTPPQPLPDTQLAPLRGALVRFAGDFNIYLVEYNGELRKVETSNVRFKNGQSVSQLDKKIIYVLAKRFESVRHGKDVIGYVPWDPRILSATELSLFIK
jgi:hypothetical protein